MAGVFMGSIGREVFCKGWGWTGRSLDAGVGIPGVRRPAVDAESTGSGRFSEGSEGLAVPVVAVVGLSGVDLEAGALAIGGGGGLPWPGDSKHRWVRANADCWQRAGSPGR